MDEEATPPGGFPMRWAITALVRDEGGRGWVEGYNEAWKTQNRRAMLEAQTHLWIRLLDRARDGTVLFRGVRSGTSEVATIDAGLLRGSTPDYVADTLLAAGTTWHAVSVFPANILHHPPGETELDSAALVGRAAEWMHRNVKSYAKGQRDIQVQACQKSIRGMTKAAALHGWNSLPTEIRGKGNKSSG